MSMILFAGIAEKHILTAAHCTGGEDGENVKDVTVWVGDHDRSEIHMQTLW